MRIKIDKRSIPLKFPFTITGYTFSVSDMVRVTLTDGTHTGQGEGVGVYYNDDLPEGMVKQLQEVAVHIGPNVTRADIQEMLPAGGARNALDSALWDFEAKRAAKPIWEMLGISPQTLTSVATLGIDTPENMAQAARAFGDYPCLKVKLNGDNPIGRIEAIRTARPDVDLIIDVNQGWNFLELKEYVPALHKLGVSMIEQPLPRGGDEELEGFKSEVPLGADESCLNLAEYPTAAKRYDVINIKLDKCGGLTEGLEIVQLAKRDGKGLMIGNMVGSSLSMAPAYVIGQHCQYIDIDGPMFLQRDIENALEYGRGGAVSIPSTELWG